MKNLRFLSIKVLLLSSSLLSAVISSHSVTIECEFILFQSWPLPMNGSYTCSVKTIVSSKENVLTQVSQNHMQGKSDKDVEILQIVGKTLMFLPQKMENFFPNLKGLYIFRTSLKTIERENLTPFPNLIFIYVGATSVETIEWDLFLDNPKIEYISFSESPIKSIGPTFLDPLSNLKEVHFSKCVCITKFIADPCKIDEMKEALIKNCPPTIEMFKKMIARILELEKQSKNDVVRALESKNKSYIF